MKRTGLLFLFVAILLMGAGCVSKTPSSPNPSSDTLNPPMPPLKTWNFSGTLPTDQISKKQARIKTADGDIVVELFADTAPMTVSNFVALAQGGFYNGLTFHRREEGFVIQGGDPKGNGTGGPGYTFPDELNGTRGYERGIVAMANRGPSTNGSQFFIMLADTPLPKLYSIFGRVTQGMEIVDQLQIGDSMTTITIEDRR